MGRGGCRVDATPRGFGGRRNVSTGMRIEEVKSGIIILSFVNFFESAIMRSRLAFLKHFTA